MHGIIKIFKVVKYLAKGFVTSVMLMVAFSAIAANKVAVIPLGDEFIVIPIPDDPPVDAKCAAYEFMPPSDYVQKILGPGTGNEGTLDAILFPPFPFQGTSTLVSATLTARVQTHPSNPTINFFMTQASGDFTPVTIATNTITTVNSSNIGILKVFHFTEGTIAYSGASDQAILSGTVEVKSRCPDSSIISSLNNFNVTVTLEPF